MMIDLPPDVTDDGFLNGRLRILQPARGYRAATDPVLLAAFTPARPGESVLELGCGVGVASLCLGARVAGLSLWGIERQPDYVALARANGERNAIAFALTEGDLAMPPPELRATDFDQVMANPPFFRAGTGTAAGHGPREMAFREEAPLAIWIDRGLRRLRPGGWLTLVHLAERLGDILGAIGERAGGIEILPVAPRVGRPATRILVRARKVDRSPLILHPPLILHDGARHEHDGDDYGAMARAVLRDGAPLFPRA